MLVYQNGNSARTRYFYYDIFQNDGWVNHFHTCFEMIYAAQGSAPVWLDGEKIDLHEGEMCLVMPNQIHAFQASAKTRLWVCVFSGDLVDSFAAQTQNQRYVRPVFRPSEALVQFFPMERNAAFESQFLLQSFLYRLCHEFHIQGFSAVPIPHTDSDSIHKILSYISTHYQQNITLSLLAREFGLNRTYLSGLIGQITHQNFRAFLNGCRLEQAKMLLKNTDMPITDICFECGYNHIRTFNRVFSEAMHMAPREYRLQRQ